MTEITRLEFRDFESFREHLHGWDTDPVQLDAGSLRLRWDQLRLEDFGLARPQVNRRIADTSGDRLSVQELVPALGVTRRALEYAFSSALEVSPAHYLRARRLNQVRRDLHAHAPLNVTAAALRHGFGLLGRFSGKYRRLFGELPSQTRRRAAPV